MNKKLIIAIDGPAGSGKTTSAKIVAERLGYIYIDTGAMYRAVTLAWLRSGLELNEQNVAKILEEHEISLEQTPDGQRTLLDGEDVEGQIRALEVTKFVSPVSAMPLVREKMVEQQREIGSRGGCVLDGRDIGTVVFPQADLKIFLIASIESRAERRRKELAAKGVEIDFEEMKKQIEERDLYDSSRAMSPLRKADDAIEIDTSNLTIDEQTNKILLAASKIALS